LISCESESESVCEMMRATGMSVFIVIKDANGISVLRQKRQCQWRGANASLSVTRLVKNTTGSDTFPQRRY
jgi:hypothetical protein